MSVIFERPVWDGMDGVCQVTGASMSHPLYLPAASLKAGLPETRNKIQSTNGENQNENLIPAQNILSLCRALINSSPLFFRWSRVRTCHPWQPGPTIREGWNPQCGQTFHLLQATPRPQGKILAWKKNIQRKDLINFSNKFLSQFWVSLCIVSLLSRFAGWK